jgi:hypothetical protein
MARQNRTVAHAPICAQFFPHLQLMEGNDSDHLELEETSDSPLPALSTDPEYMAS